MSSRELSEWMAYERVAGPLGGQRIDVAAALISATIANVNREPRTQAYPVTDFLVDWDGPAEPASMSPDELWAQIRQAHAAITATSKDA